VQTGRSLILNTPTGRVRRTDETKIRGTIDNPQFLIEWMPTLLRRFDQLEIYMVSYPIDRV
jgi:hypothetical protein